MSSLPSWVTSAFDFKEALRIAAITAPIIMNRHRNHDDDREHDEERAKVHDDILTRKRPGFDFDERADGSSATPIADRAGR